MKIIGIVGSKEKRVVSNILNEFFRNSGLLVKRIHGEDFRKKVIADKKNIEKIKDTDILIIEIDKFNIKDIIKLGIDLDIIVDIDMNLDGYRKEDYLNEKIKLVKFLKENKLLVVSTDDENSMKLSYENKKIIVLAYGLNARSSLTASSLNLDNKLKFNLCLQRTIKTISNSYVEPFEHPIEVNLVGADNIYCAFAALSVALYFNVDLGTIVDTFLMIESGKTKVI